MVVRAGTRRWQTLENGDIPLERLAAEQYRGHLLPRGLAPHDRLVGCVKRVSLELGSQSGPARAGTSNCLRKACPAKRSVDSWDCQEST